MKDTLHSVIIYDDISTLKLNKLHRQPLILGFTNITNNTTPSLVTTGGFIVSKYEPLKFL